MTNGNVQIAEAIIVAFLCGEPDSIEGSLNGVVLLALLPVLCSGSMIPDTNVGGKIATISEVSDDQKTTFLYS
ncbi:hypothetical protein ACOSZC_20030 [Marinobacter salsuginis]